MHLADVPPRFIVPATKLSYGTLICYQASVCFTKLSVVVLYLRVFTTSRTGRWLLFGVLGFLICLNIASQCVSIFQCHPIDALWAENPQPDRCINTIPMFYVSAASKYTGRCGLHAVCYPSHLVFKNGNTAKVRSSRHSRHGRSPHNSKHNTLCTCIRDSGLK